MQQAQVCIVGGGCVGLTLALGLAKNNISVHVIDASSEPALLTCLLYTSDAADE